MPREPSTVTLPSGIYLIQNEFSKNHLTFRTGRQDEPITSRSFEFTAEILDIVMWNVICRPNGRYEIQNIGTRYFARHAFGYSVHASIHSQQKNSDFEWNIFNIYGRDLFWVIGRHTGRELRWGHVSKEEGVPIRLYKNTSNPQTSWIFQTVSLGSDNPMFVYPSCNALCAERFERVLSERNDLAQALRNEQNNYQRTDLRLRNLQVEYDLALRRVSEAHQATLRRLQELEDEIADRMQVDEIISESTTLQESLSPSYDQPAGVPLSADCDLGQGITTSSFNSEHDSGATETIHNLFPKSPANAIENSLQSPIGYDVTMPEHQAQSSFSFIAL